jgi:hypothetical protein
MNTLIILQTLLILHLSGLTLMAGTTVTEYITFKTFSKQYEKEKERALNLLGLMNKLSALLGIGAALLILSGTGLLILTNGIFLHQFWFKVKLVMILTLILNGFLVGLRQESKLKTSININGPVLCEQTTNAMQNLKIFYMVQMSLFFVIILLSVFKFS